MKAKSSNPNGRPVGTTELTAEQLGVMLSKIREGVMPYRAAILAGRTKQAFYDWRDKGAAGIKPYTEIMDSVERAEAEYHAGLEVCISDAKSDDWKAAMAMLEKRLRAEYGQKIEVTAKVADLDAADDATLAAIALGKTNAVAG